MNKPRDWADRYYDGDDLGAVDELVFPIDDEAEDCYGGWESCQGCTRCLDLTLDLEEEDADE